MPDCSMEYLEHILNMKEMLKIAKSRLRSALPAHIIEKMSENEKTAITAAVSGAMANIERKDLKIIKDNKKLLEEFELEVKYLIPGWMPGCHDDKIMNAATNFCKAMKDALKRI